MSEQIDNDSVRRRVEVDTPITRAFAVFTDGFATWWPRAYTWASEVLETITIEPRVGGRCFERGPHGYQCDWGRVLVWEPPRRLVFTWQISPERVPEPDPAKASEVEVRFVAEGPQVTCVELVHRGFSRHGEGGEGYRAGMATPEGWSYILDRYAAALT